MTARPSPMTTPNVAFKIELRQEQLAQPLRRVIERSCRALEILAAEQSDESIAQIFSLKKEKIRKITTIPVVVKGTASGRNIATSASDAPGSG